MFVIDRLDMTFPVKVALNPNTTYNQPECFVFKNLGSIPEIVQ